MPVVLRQLPLVILPVLFTACERGGDSSREEQSAQPAAPAEELPTPAPAPAVPSAHLLEGIREHVAMTGDSEIPPFRYALIDLNGDGREEAIVLLAGPDWCQADGCTLLVFRGDDEGSLLISSSPGANEPLRVAANRTDGWQNLIIRTSGARDVVMRFDGSGYPRNPSSQTAANPAQLSAARPLTLTNVAQPT